MNTLFLSMSCEYWFEMDFDCLVQPLFLIRFLFVVIMKFCSNKQDKILCSLKKRFDTNKEVTLLHIHSLAIKIKVLLMQRYF
jgi:hypothetical protein